MLHLTASVLCDLKLFSREFEGPAASSWMIMSQDSILIASCMHA